MLQGSSLSAPRTGKVPEGRQNTAGGAAQRNHRDFYRYTGAPRRGSVKRASCQRASFMRPSGTPRETQKIPVVTLVPRSTDRLLSDRPSGTFLRLHLLNGMSYAKMAKGRSPSLLNQNYRSDVRIPKAVRGAGAGFFIPDPSRSFLRGRGCVRWTWHPRLRRFADPEHTSAIVLSRLKDRSAPRS